jgi:beta-hydroxylase
MALTGLYDLRRNHGLDQSMAKRYFTGNGLLTWILSPINTLMDFLALPYVNKGIYYLSDLPPAYQAEIQTLIDAAYKHDLVNKLEEAASSRSRTMAIWKWYGENAEPVVDIPEYHEEYKYIQTIAVSVFNKKQSTSKHFGPLRATLRVLYNINDIKDRTAYIDCNEQRHYWCDNKLYIFDDTLMHQSVNETDQVRYCLFVDILRPSLCPQIFRTVVKAVDFIAKSKNHMFYKNWDVIKK